MSSDLKKIYESYLSIKDAFIVVQRSDEKLLLKTKYEGLTLDEKKRENKKALMHSEELIMLSMFAIFERKIRNILIDNIQNIKMTDAEELQNRFLLIVENKLEFLEIYKLLKMFDFLPGVEHSRIKQIAEYRNWLAHGKNQNKLPSNKALTARVVLEDLDNYIRRLDAVFVSSQ